MAGSIFDLEPNKVPSNPTEYSTFIYGTPKIGKTTFAYDMYGKRGLFIATEDRHKALPGAMIMRVNSWVDYLKVMGELRNPKAKELYDVIILDTVENLYGMLEKFVAAKWKEKTIGERTDIWGKDWTDVKKMWKDGLNMIPDSGFVPAFIAHATEQTVQIPASGVLQSDLEGATVELKVVKDKNDNNKTLEVYEFSKYMPDMKDKVFAPINKMVDNILFANTTLDVSTGKEQRVLYLRDTLQWMAGSTFENIDPIIPLDAKAYEKAVKKALGKVNKEDTTKESSRNVKEELNYKEIMDKIKAAGNEFHKAGKLDKLNAISESIFGLGEKMTDASEAQVELLYQALNEIEAKAELENIKL